MPYSAPKVRCADRSGYPCDRIVALDSPHCGNRAHFPGANGGVRISRRTPGAVPLTVDEDYDLIDDAPDLDPVTFDTRKVHVTDHAQQAWGQHPKVLQAKIRQALLRGGYWRTVTGGHLLELGRHQMLLSADGRRCESYVYLPERPPVESGEPVGELVEPAWDREAVELSPEAVRQFAGRHRVTEDDAADELFALLDDAAARGKRYAENGYHHFWVDGFTLVLTPDGRTVVGYRTVHAERTPSEVRNKVKSRFQRRASEDMTAEERAALHAERDNRVADVPADRWVPTAHISDHFDPQRARITGGVIAHDRADRSQGLCIVG